MDSFIDDVYELIRFGRGDPGRLEHIKNTLEDKRTLFTSDRKYVEELAAKYLVTKEKTNVVTNQPDSIVESSYKPKFCGKCGVSLPDNADFCVECGHPIKEFKIASPTLGTRSKDNENIKFTKKEHHYEPKKRKQIGTGKAIGIGIGVFFLFMIIISAAFVELGSASNDEGLTENQKSIIQIIKDSCSNNMAYLQSDAAGKAVEEKCMEKVEEKIQEFKQMNIGNKVP